MILREVVNGLMYILSTGCYSGGHPATCRRARRCTIISTCGVGIALDLIHHELYVKCREAMAGKPVLPPPPSLINKAAVRVKDKGGKRRDSCKIVASITCN